MINVARAAFFVIFIFLSGCISLSASQQNNKIIERQQKPSKKQIIQQLDKQIVVDMRRYQIPGAAIALVSRHGILWAKGYGYLSESKQDRVNVDTLFSFESNSKMFTALGILFAQQEGLLKLEDPVSRYLPHLLVRCACGLCNANAITLQELISHSSGFMHEAPLGNNFDGAQSSFHLHMQSILEHENWLLFMPGAQKSYSNIGFDLAGYVLEKVSNKSFADYMQDNVLAQLNMRSSTFDASTLGNITNKTNEPEGRNIVAQPKERSDAGLGGNIATGYAPIIGEIASNKSMLPSGGLYSSVKDMAKYIQFQLSSGYVSKRQLLNSKLLNRMYELTYPVVGQKTGYTLGLWRGIRNHHLFFMHLGRGFGFSSTVIWYPKLNYGVVVVLNKFGSNVDTLIANKLLDELIGVNNYSLNKKINLQFPVQSKLNIENLEQKIQGNYVSSQGDISLMFNKKHQFGIKGVLHFGPFGNSVDTSFVPLRYLSIDKFISPAEDVYTYKHAISSCSLAYLQRQQDGSVWYYNDAGQEPFGPNDSKWKQYVGKYYVRTYGLQITYTVSLKNGYLYFDHYKLREVEPGLFQIPSGEIVDLRRNHDMTFKNIQLIQ